MKLFVRVWRISVDATFFLLCLRFQLVTLNETGRGHWGIEVLIIVSLALGFFLQNEAVFAFTAAVPLLGGLAHIFPYYGHSPIILIFSALFIGKYLRDSFSKSTTPPETTSTLPFWIALVADLFLSSVIIALIAQLIGNRYNVAFWDAFLFKSNVAFGDPNYGLYSAFLWLSGIYFFRCLCAQGHTLVSWIKPIFLIWGLSSFIFFFFQFVTGIPEGWVTGSFAPFEDISSFGSITASLLVFSLASFRPQSGGRLLAGIGYLLLLASMVAASWSRATWLVSIASIVLLFFLRVPAKMAPVGLLCCLVLTYFINRNIDKPAWHTNAYVSRFDDLVRIEAISKKSPERINLYYKALGMINEHPIVGHGIGSFYLKSRHYARVGDPLASVPNFAHNAWLQIATELGIPVALLFGILNVMIVASALQLLLANRRPVQNPTNNSTRPAFAATSKRFSVEWTGENRDVLVLLGVVMSFAAYLWTQMTGNSLNVYASNQILFWFTGAATLAACSQLRDKLNRLHSRLG